jgi:ubiquinone/menaquinone biosynthesis C-methylase UbiE
MNPWSIFWRQGHSTTFGQYYAKGYDGKIAEWWDEAIKALPENPTVIEVGCGNCSLLSGLVRSGTRGKYIGVDIADVNPSAVAQEGLEESGIELVLHAKTPAEKLPEEDETADLVVSVFGIEYSDLSKSLPEAYRVLKKGGKLSTLLHHRDSVVNYMSYRAYNEFNAKDIEAVLNSLLMISRERDRSPSLQALKDNAVAEEHRMLLNQFAEQYMSNKDPDTANIAMFEFMTHALRLFKLLGEDRDTRESFIQQLAIEHRASHERYGQMMAVAMDDQVIDGVKSKLRDFGFKEIRAEVIMSDDKTLAWKLCAEK